MGRILDNLASDIKFVKDTEKKVIADATIRMEKSDTVMAKKLKEQSNKIKEIKKDDKEDWSDKIKKDIKRVVENGKDK